MRQSQLEREAARRLPALFAELLGREAEDVHVSRVERSADFVVEIAGGPRLVIELKASGRTASVTQAALQARRAADELGGLPVVLVPYMGEAGARAATEAGAGYVDLSGNAHLRDESLHVRVEGRPNQFPARGRPSSPFAPVSARLTRRLLLDPSRWWRQAELADATGLDDGRVSKLVRRLWELELVERADARLRPRDPDALLNAWAEDYDFARHDTVAGHHTGAGAGLARDLAGRLEDDGIGYALTGLAAAWMLDRFAQFRLVSVYVEADPREVAETLGVRAEARGANVQLIAPNDRGVFDGALESGGARCVAPVQAYLDLLALPERAKEAAAHLREELLRWEPRA